MARLAAALLAALSLALAGEPEVWLGGTWPPGVTLEVGGRAGELELAGLLWSRPAGEGLSLGVEASSALELGPAGRAELGAGAFVRDSGGYWLRVWGRGVLGETAVRAGLGYAQPLPPRELWPTAGGDPGLAAELELRRRLGRRLTAWGAYRLREGERIELGAERRERRGSLGAGVGLWDWREPYLLAQARLPAGRGVASVAARLGGDWGLELGYATRSLRARVALEPTGRASASLSGRDWSLAVEAGPERVLVWLRLRAEP